MSTKSTPPCGYCGGGGGGYTSGAREYHYYTDTTTRDDCYETTINYDYPRPRRRWALHLVRHIIKTDCNSYTTVGIVPTPEKLKPIFFSSRRLYFYVFFKNIITIFISSLLNGIILFTVRYWFSRLKHCSAQRSRCHTLLLLIIIITMCTGIHGIPGRYFFIFFLFHRHTHIVCGYKL